MAIFTCNKPNKIIRWITIVIMCKYLLPTAMLFIKHHHNAKFLSRKASYWCRKRVKRQFNHFHFPSSKVNLGYKSNILILFTCSLSPLNKPWNTKIPSTNIECVTEFLFFANCKLESCVFQKLCLWLVLQSMDLNTVTY